VSFEVRIYPKQHLAYFERVKDEEKLAFADALRSTLLKLYQGLNDPSYNFFIHTAPSDGKNYDDYHWHMEILPHTATWAGFELGTGIEISTIEPEKAAEYLKNI
jgi:UDPglucose--hexose-1-phosphate uridylyltransferase